MFKFDKQRGLYTTRSDKLRKILTLLGYCAFVSWLMWIGAKHGFRGQLPPHPGIGALVLYGIIVLFCAGLLALGPIWLLSVIGGWSTDCEVAALENLLEWAPTGTIFMLAWTGLGLQTTLITLGIFAFVVWLDKRFEALMHEGFRRLSRVMRMVWTLLVMFIIWMDEGRASDWQMIFYAWMMPPLLLDAVVAAGCWIWRGFRGEP